MRRHITTLLLIVCCYCSGFAQDTLAPFYQDIRAFKSKDSIAMPPRNAILFVGSSSFTKWVDVHDYFPGYTIINRGFGGSSLPDLSRYADQVIFPYHPKQIVIYCGENDIAAEDTVTAELVFARFKQLFELIRSRMSKVPIAYISMKPSPSRERFWPKMIKANELIKNYLSTRHSTAYIDVYHQMFNKDGILMKDIFLEDNLHMNAKGYAIWKKVIGQYLRR
jgi:lysophospholipase L1-like esterase